MEGGFHSTSNPSTLGGPAAIICLQEQGSPKRQNTEVEYTMVAELPLPLLHDIPCNA
jgi:hypothetical protein